MSDHEKAMEAAMAVYHARPFRADEGPRPFVEAVCRAYHAALSPSEPVTEPLCVCGHGIHAHDFDVRSCVYCVCVRFKPAPSEPVETPPSEADAAFKHFCDRIRDKAEGGYGPFTDADWRAALALRAAGVRQVPSPGTPELSEEVNKVEFMEMWARRLHVRLIDLDGPDDNQRADAVQFLCDFLVAAYAVDRPPNVKHMARLVVGDIVALLSTHNPENAAQWIRDRRDLIVDRAESAFAVAPSPGTHEPSEEAITEAMRVTEDAMDIGGPRRRREAYRSGLRAAYAVDCSLAEQRAIVAGQLATVLRRAVEAVDRPLVSPPSEDLTPEQVREIARATLDVWGEGGIEPSDVDGAVEAVVVRLREAQNKGNER